METRTIKQSTIIFLAVLILSFLTAYFIFAGDDPDSWDEPTLVPPFDNIGALINMSSDDQEKEGALTVSELTTSGGKLYLAEGSIKRVAEVIGFDDLFLLSDEYERGPIEIYGSQLNFYSNEQLEWQISSTGTLRIGDVSWEKLIGFPEDNCPEDQHAVGINEDGTFKCSFIDYCKIFYKCAVYDDVEKKCKPKLNPEDDIPACQKCVEGSLYPVNYDVNEQDTIGPNVCDNSLGDGSPKDTCYGCDGNGNCSFQTSDVEGQCPENNCFTGKCSGTGYSCGTYTANEKRECGLCMKCNPDGSGSCVPQTSSEDLGNECSGPTKCRTGDCSGTGASCQVYTSGQYGCGQCQGCNASGNCENINTDWEVGTYGCSAGTATDPNRCYQGECINCGGWGNAGYCWYNGAAGANCINTCSGRGGVYKGNCDWPNDPSNCSTCLHWYPGRPCGGADSRGPWRRYNNTCYYNQGIYCDCQGWETSGNRQCACNR